MRGFCPEGCCWNLSPAHCSPCRVGIRTTQITPCNHALHSTSVTTIIVPPIGRRQACTLTSCSYGLTNLFPNQEPHDRLGCIRKRKSTPLSGVSAGTGGSAAHRSSGGTTRSGIKRRSGGDGAMLAAEKADISVIGASGISSPF